MGATYTRVRTSNVFWAVVSATSLVVGCSGTSENVDGTSDALSSTVRVPAGGSGQYVLNATSPDDLALTIDCHPPANPDAQGPVLRIQAPTLDLDAHNPTPAGYWQQALRVPSGQHTITITSEGDAATCSVKTAPLPASAQCRAWKAWRSPNTDHTHIHVGDSASGWEEFPASGNHWGAWAKWSTDYPAPVQRGFMLHNLEHGGLIFSYKCESSDESTECKDAHDALLQLAQSLGFSRVILTPDPTQPEMYGIRGWRMAYSSDCWNEDSASVFARANYRHGREDADSDPPIPFDPTTTNVPCQDLMAAPDSCN